MGGPGEVEVIANIEGGPYDGEYRVSENSTGVALKVWGMYMVTNFGTVGKRAKAHPDSKVEWFTDPETGKKEGRIVGGPRQSHKYEIVSREEDGNVVKIRAKYLGPA